MNRNASRRSKHVGQGYEILTPIRLFDTRIADVPKRKFHPTPVLLPREAPAELLREVLARSVELIGFGLVSRPAAEEHLQAGPVDQAPVQTPAPRDFKDRVRLGECFAEPSLGRHEAKRRQFIMIIVPSPCGEPDIRGTRAVILNAHATAHRQMTIQETRWLHRRRFGCADAGCEECESDPQGRRDASLDPPCRKKLHVGRLVSRSLSRKPISLDTIYQFSRYID